MGYRSDAGTLRIAALPEADGVPSEPEPLAEAVAREGLSFTLAAARGRGPWVPFGRLVLGAPAEPLDPDVRFDAVLQPAARAWSPTARWPGSGRRPTRRARGPARA